LSIARLPKGVYGFTYSPGQEEPPVFAKKSYHSFEIHKLPDGSEHLAGYVTPFEAASLQAAKPGTEVRIFPDAWGESNRLVTVDLGLTLRVHRTPTRQEGNPYRIVLA
jgi:hypothetical protein